MNAFNALHQIYKCPSIPYSSQKERRERKKIIEKKMEERLIAIETETKQKKKKEKKGTK